MMKGAFPLIAGIILALLISGIVLSSGIIGQINLKGLASIPGSYFDATCVPGTILKPIKQTILCEKNPESLTGVYIPEKTQYGTWPLVYERVYFQCPPASDAAREGCQVSVTTGGSFKIGEYGSIQSGPATLNYNYGDVVDIRLLNTGMYVQARYTTKQLSLYDLTGGVFQRKICDSCDLTCTGMPTEIYNNLPKDLQNYMNVGDSVETVIGWQEYPVPGNYIEWNGQAAQCVKVSAASATIYDLDKYEGQLSCYYYRGDVIANVECCPGEVFLERECSDDGKWVDIGDSSDALGDCCIGGICSVAYCPGGGSWDYENWNPGEPLDKYQCYAPTGDCLLADRIYDIQCNPLTGEGCPLNQRCDPATRTCTDKPISIVSCTEFGFECCVSGQVAENVELRSCEEAGYPENYVCVNGFCQNPLPVNVCNYDQVCTENEVADCPDCQVCDAWCQLTAFMWLWLIGIIIAVVVLLVLSYFVPFVSKILFASPLLALLLIVLLGFAIAWLFSVQVASLAATLL